MRINAINRGVFFLAVALVALGEMPPQRATAEPIRVLAIGDSITFGISSVPIGPGYVEILAEDLGPQFEVINLGCGGSNAATWRPETGPAVCLGRYDNQPVDYFDELVAPNTPAEIATIMLGTNDAIIGLPVWIYLGSLTEVIQGLFDLGVAEVVLMTPPPHPSTDADTQELIAGYVAGIIEPSTGLCASISGVLCGPNVFELLDPALDFAPFNEHPNATGHAKIAAALFETVVAIPEPSTALLLPLGLVGIAAGRRRNR